MTQIKLRRDTSSAFASSNPILGNGEPAYETDTKKLKIGDGTTTYTQLEYFSAGGGSSTNITATLPLKIVDGVISLEVDGQTIQVVDGKLTATGGDKVTVLSNEYTTISPKPTNGVWYKSQGNGYIVARFMSSGGNQFCQLAVNASGTGSLDDNSIYNQTAFSQGSNNGFTLLLPISSTQYYAVNTNFGKGLQWARFIPFITV